MNIKLLRKIQKAIARAPQRLDMDIPITSYKCKTTACIAGHAVLLSQKGKRFNKVAEDFVNKFPDSAFSTDWQPIEIRARNLLKLTRGQANRLFLSWGWPDEYQANYRGTPVERVRVAIKRIDHFIETKGLE